MAKYGEYEMVNGAVANDLQAENDQLRFVLRQIAFGNPGGGRPLGGETVRQMARRVLVAIGCGWSRPGGAPDG